MVVTEGVQGRLAAFRAEKTTVACRECGICKLADVSSFHVKQLKAYAKHLEPNAGEAPLLPACLDCAQNAKQEDNKHPVGQLLNWHTGEPLVAASSQATYVEYRNEELQFPYAVQECPSLWLTNPKALLHMRGGLRYYPNYFSADEEQQLLKIVDADDGRRWTKVFRRRQQFYGEVYYHTSQDVSAVQPRLGMASDEAIRADEAPCTSTTAQDMAPMQFLVDKFYNAFFEAGNKPGQCEEECFVFGRNRLDFPTQILVNEYLDNFGISSHFEDEEAFGRVIATISLLSPIFMSIEKPREHSNSCQDLLHETKVLLEPRSLFVMSGDCRYHWRHGISRHRQVFIPCTAGAGGSSSSMRVVERAAPLYRRVSFTIRHLLPGRKQVGSHQQSGTSAEQEQ
ncbi:unnamed protein product [Polarella glacialis]|uniref:Alpha-ketoglutarate-dependent dioxygenase AlkB-like domain-containing protein n=1 Tax=Polarella glacialis TaxID=89957 RepID=A0A813EZ35_POLGL|nr:unnamed protein product [Polarella glacialis]CAE8622632.1 unnamed protein product [Polarella glacialis]